MCDFMVENNLVVDGCLNVASAARRRFLALVALGPRPPHLLTSDGFLIRPERTFFSISQTRYSTVNGRRVT